MKEAIVAIRQILLIYTIMCVMLLCLGGADVWHNRADSKQSGRSILTFCLDCLVVCAIIIVCIVPVLRDYVQPSHNIKQIECIYINNEARHSGSPSSLMGFYSVELDFNGEQLNLKTAPFRNEIFLQGCYHVVAYYAPVSKNLLHIEIISEIDIPSKLE